MATYTLWEDAHYVRKTRAAIQRTQYHRWHVWRVASATRIYEGCWERTQTRVLRTLPPIVWDALMGHPVEGISLGDYAVGVAILATELLDPILQRCFSQRVTFILRNTHPWRELPLPLREDPAFACFWPLWYRRRAPSHTFLTVAPHGCVWALAGLSPTTIQREFHANGSSIDFIPCRAVSRGPEALVFAITRIIRRWEAENVHRS